ncbi:hypothetical protein C2845_PM05G00410 [Panicum miliaceum]|uniref:Uncharacterized protein n=1 Tax=Panicum miliaceum TaxID=4540 RepID=A0A3L6SYF9_PANMI|nr:hypothetical protein C2845_PM05G00410 [Panicum miliaceum]
MRRTFLAKRVARSFSPPHRLHRKKPDTARSTTSALPACASQPPAPPPRRHQTSIAVEEEKGSTSHLTSDPVARVQKRPRPHHPQAAWAGIGGACPPPPPPAHPHAPVAQPQDLAGATSDLGAPASAAAKTPAADEGAPGGRAAVLAPSRRRRRGRAPPPPSPRAVRASSGPLERRHGGRGRRWELRRLGFEARSVAHAGGDASGRVQIGKLNHNVKKNEGKITIAR